MAEPSEDDTGNFVSFTGLSREKAILFLKANHLDLQKALNAYFENPDGVPTVEPQNEWATFNNPQSHSLPSFHIENSDSTPGNGYSAAPSRPPSRMNVSETPNDRKYEGIGQDNATAEPPRQNLSAAQLEERDLQQAVAMSLGQDFGHQESGVITEAKNSHFGPATQETYDETSWGMTLMNTTTREEIISPDPEDRQRNAGEPAFLRPSQEALYTGGFLTILHSIPLAREALLLREKIIHDYGHDSQWWNGQPIMTPRIVTLDNPYAEGNDWDDILYETQRLMTFLDSTRRSFGSIDALASLRTLRGFDGDSGVEKFLEAWQEAAVRATPGNQLSMVFSSCAMRTVTEDDIESPNQREFFVLNTYVDPGQSQTLYDVLDDAIWPDIPGEDLDDVWLDHVGEILTIKLENYGTNAMNVKIPPIFYPDRYMEARRDTVRELRLKRLEVIQKITHLESMAARYRCAEAASRTGMSNQELLEKAAQAAAVALPKFLPLGTTGISSAEVQQIAEQLRGVAGLIRDKLNQIDAEKQKARETLRDNSNILTDSSASSELSPHYKYTLRGLCTAPHITYVLKRKDSDQGGDDLIEMEDKKPEEWQWWRISFSVDDAKTQQAMKSESKNTRNNKSINADVIGYTAHQVREIEVLKAARESRSLLLVYANANAVKFPYHPAPSALQEFVNTDNISFQAELDAAAHLYHNDEGLGEPGDTIMEDWPKMDIDDYDEITPAATEGNSKVNVFDYEVNTFDEEPSNQGQEMQEREGKALLHQS